MHFSIIKDRTIVLCALLAAFLAILALILKQHSASPQDPVVRDSRTARAHPTPREAKCEVSASPEDALQPLLDSHPGSAVCLTPGTYRISKPLTPTPGQSLIGSREAILSGSIPLRNWTPGAATGTWVSRLDEVGIRISLDSNEAQCEEPTPATCRQRNRIFSGSRQIESAGSLQALAAGSAFLDPTANTVTLFDDPTRSNLEISYASAAIESTKSDVTVRGLTIERFANQAQFGAVSLGPSSWAYDLEVRQNHGVGVKIAYGTDTKVVNCAIHSNGQLGVSAYKSAGIEIANNDIRGNNVDGFWIADWEAGGIKVTESSGNILQNQVHGNKSLGIWLDIADHDLIVNNNIVTDNAADGLRVEISQSIDVIENTFERNGRGMGRGVGRGIWDGAGITINTSQGVRVARNHLSDNINGVSVQARDRGAGPWGHYKLSQVDIAENEISLRSLESVGLVAESGIDCASLTVRFVRNTYPSRSEGQWYWCGAPISKITWDTAIEKS